MQMVQTRGRGNPNPGAGKVLLEVGLAGMRKIAPSPSPSPRPPPPPSYTAEVFFAQFLGSQRNMEQMQQNMEAC